LVGDLRDCVKLLLTRRSIRRFRDEEVPWSLVEEVLDAARYAPSAVNSQPWKFVVVTDRALLDRLAGIHAGALPLRRAPLGIVVVCDKSRSPKSYMLDCANATMYIMLAAHAHGLGTVSIQAIGYQDAIREILGIPEDREPVAVLAVGWPAEQPQPRPRRPLSEILHINRYGSKPQQLLGKPPAA
jgi:nitroreductase